MNDADVARAVALLRAGRPVVIPTDTVYGVAAPADDPEAVTAVFAAKGRRPDKPLPVLAARAEDLLRVVVLDERARSLAARYWPGALTLVLPRAAGFDADLGGERADTVAVRVPDCPVARRVLAAAGPLAVTSANRSGEPPASTADEARAALGDAVALYLDDGPRRGAPSTIVSLVGEPAVLRTGSLSPEPILALAAGAV